MSDGMNHELISRDPSVTSMFKALQEEQHIFDGSGLSAVAIGGGTGVPVSIRALLSLGCETSAVVAMADDGGSTGKLREKANVMAPGDIRKCIAAFAADPEDPFTRAFNARFEFADNHTLGNLILTALEHECDDFPSAIRICESLLNAQGKVYPSTLNRITLTAETVDGRSIVGQSLASHAPCHLERVGLSAEEPIRPYPEAIDALHRADLIVLGPGSLFTSIIPNLLVPGIVDAIREGNAEVIYVCSLADLQGETLGMSALDYYRALEKHGMKGLIDYMVIQDESGLPFFIRDIPIPPVIATQRDIDLIEASGTTVFYGDYRDPLRPTRHDGLALRDLFWGVLSTCRSRRR